MLTVRFTAGAASVLAGTLRSPDLHTKGCSSSVMAEGRSAGFLRKHRRRKSFPSGDKVSGIGGSLCKILNIA